MDVEISSKSISSEGNLDQNKLLNFVLKYILRKHSDHFLLKGGRGVGPNLMYALGRLTFI